MCSQASEYPPNVHQWVYYTSCSLQKSLWWTVVHIGTCFWVVNRMFCIAQFNQFHLQVNDSIRLLRTELQIMQKPGCWRCKSSLKCSRSCPTKATYVVASLDWLLDNVEKCAQLHCLSCPTHRRSFTSKRRCVQTVCWLTGFCPEMSTKKSKSDRKQYLVFIQYYISMAFKEDFDKLKTL